jgi:Domain of unknown function (DUF4349)
MSLSPNLKKALLIGGGLILVCFLGIVILTLLGPATGNVYSSTVTSLGPNPAEQAARGAIEAPAAPFGLGGGAGAQPSAADSFAALPTQVANNLPNQQTQDTARLIIRNGTVSIAVENTYVAEKGIEAIVAQMAPDGAFVVSTNESPAGYGDSPYINMAIRVPAAHFNEAIDAIAKMAAKGTTPTLSKTGEDVTDQYVDVKARLDSLEAARARLQQIMSEAQNTNDLLQAEQQLTQREADIESLKGRMQYLEQSAALSSITITLQPYQLAQPVDTNWRPGETLRRAVDNLLNSARNFGDFLIIFVVSVLPWLLVMALIVYGVYRFIRAQMRRARARNAASDSDQS